MTESDQYGCSPEDDPASQDKLAPVHRSWNTRILPDCVVIAIDEHDPRDGSWPLRVPDERPPYPRRTELLSDAHYVRYIRTAMQELYIAEASAELAAPEASKQFGQLLVYQVEMLEKEVMRGNSKYDYPFRAMSAVLKDYRLQPNAVLDSHC